MDCNKEEALRAKHVAEEKMENKDFSGALKIAIKAQSLHPELENISQIILVCEVHISAESKSYGSEKDWYGILKIEPSADELAIKKQYRKLALILHPDKNKFPGSTDAFKLIGEAQRVLLDHDKRTAHDNKRGRFGNISAPNWIPKQPNRQSNVHQHPWNRGHSGNFTGGHSGNFQFEQVQIGVSKNRSTFWTVCPFCSVRYQFYKDDVLNKVVHCQSCKKSFSAYEINGQGTTAAAQSTTQTQTQTRVPRKPTEGVKRNFTSKLVFEKNKPTKPNRNVNKKRKKIIEESSESSDSSETSSESEENDGKNKNPENKKDFEYVDEQPRRSSRSKRNVSYKENVIEIDPSIKRAEDTFWKAEVRIVVEDDQKEEKHDPKSNNKKGETVICDDTDDESEPEVFECPDPEFSDFEKDRKEESFKTGQIWACYDTVDAMPRFYAFVKKILSPSFKLQIHWLKPDPENLDETKWVEKDLPVSCGRFKRGKLDKTEDLLSFSHLVSWESGQKAGFYNIIPRKGETWALFKNWSMTWHFSKKDEKRKFEYEFVEILSDYDENVGARVLYLEKMKGYVCLFRRKVGGEKVIETSDKFRFAHMVPSCRMSGDEREGVPKGSYELDPASLPLSVFETVNL